MRDTTDNNADWAILDGLPAVFTQGGTWHIAGLMVIFGRMDYAGFYVRETT